MFPAASTPIIPPSPSIATNVTFTTGTPSTISIFPTLVAAASGVMNYKDDVQMQCLYDTDVVSGMVYSDGILMDNGQIRLLEKL